MKKKTREEIVSFIHERLFIQGVIFTWNNYSDICTRLKASRNDWNQYEQLEGKERTDESKQNRTCAVCWDVHIQFIGKPLVMVVVVVVIIW